MVRVVTTRADGDMKDPAARARALERAGLGGRRLHLLDQVHGTDVRRPPFEGEGDGWLGVENGPVLGVFVADCLPIFVWERECGAFGVFHSGWRGTAAGMPRAAVAAFGRAGVSPERLEAEIGPHIGPCCYRVGAEVRERFRPESARGERVDLGAEARAQLLEAGLRPERVAVSRECTCCGKDRFSFRRDKRDSRMLAFICHV